MTTVVLLYVLIGLVFYLRTRHVVPKEGPWYVVPVLSVIWPVVIVVGFIVEDVLKVDGIKRLGNPWR